MSSQFHRNLLLSVHSFLHTLCVVAVWNKSHLTSFIYLFCVAVCKVTFSAWRQSKSESVTPNPNVLPHFKTAVCLGECPDFHILAQEYYPCILPRTAQSKCRELPTTGVTSHNLNRHCMDCVFPCVLFVMLFLSRLCCSLKQGTVLFNIYYLYFVQCRVMLPI